MMTRPSVFRLTVVQIDQTCLFELAWGQAQRLKAQIDYSDFLSLTYQEWQRIYLSFYQTDLLGQAESSGTIELPNSDWHGLLVKAEASLLSAFNQWLRQSELYEIRSAIHAAKFSINPVADSQSAKPLDVFLTCTPIELERLPWEAWELWSESSKAASSMIRVARTPANIRHESSQRPCRRPRLLVIIGADERNKFTYDLQAVKNQFKQIAQIEAIGWQLTAQDIPELKLQIWDAIAAPTGWDALLFFGHSNESALTGGELAIAPHTWISIRELTPQLLKAKENGLQFALFNSCSGLNIAESLISLGLGQVAIMREPIHNAVAQHFLIHFLQKLAEQKNVHQALQSACQDLLDQKIVYPSAALVPSLFRYPNAPLFQIELVGWKQWLNSWQPTWQETLFTGALALVSLLWPVQDRLLDLRMLTQAVYRDVIATAQESSSWAAPPVLLVQIDDKSLRLNNITQRRPMDRAYLAKVVYQLAKLHPRVIGIDYVLDEPQPKTDKALAQSIQRAAQQGIRFVFATVPNESNPSETNSKNSFLNPQWGLQGSIEGSHRFIPPIASHSNCDSDCPFAQMLASASSSASDEAIASLSHTQKRPWLTTINDLSIRPDEAFQPISSLAVFTETSKYWNQLKLSQPPIIIIAPGGYAEAGVQSAGEDNLPMPWVVSYWRSRLGQNPASVFTGGEAHAYRVYQLLHRISIIPLPDLLFIGFATLLGKGIQRHLKERSFKRVRWQGTLGVGTVSYGFLGLQLYISAGVLCPWLFPSVAFWYYVFPALEKKGR
jgi:CHASE2 domain/CHAT domain